jgi:hypothetical protein
MKKYNYLYNFLEVFSPIRLKAHQKLVLRMMFCKEIINVALHRPYMIKAIMTTKCPACGRWFTFPKIVSQRTAYHDEYSNYFCGCKECVKENDVYWKERWEEYYSSIF